MLRHVVLAGGREVMGWIGVGIDNSMAAGLADWIDKTWCHLPHRGMIRHLNRYMCARSYTF